MHRLINLVQTLMAYLLYTVLAVRFLFLNQLNIKYMFKIILWKLGLYQKYYIEYNGLFTGSKNQVIEFYYYKNCPKWLLKEAVLTWLKGRVLTCVSNVIYIERINEWTLQRQFVF